MIYDYLVSSYAHQENLRYSAVHKKSELKKTYCDIVKISKTSPSYLINASKETQEFALSLKENSLILQHTLANLQSNSLTSPFSYKQVISDNEDVLTAEITTKDHTNLPEPFSIQIDKLATTQINIGKSVYKTSTPLKEGVYEFNIDIEDRSYPFRLKLPEKATNEDVLSKISQAINRSDVPIQAHKTSGKNEKQIQLVIESTQTGSVNEEPIFSFSDINFPSGSHGCTNYYDLNNISRFPENSQFTLNGEYESTLSNDFTLNHCLHLQMHSPNSEPVQINYTGNAQKVLAEIEALAETYNNLVHLSYNQGDPPRLAVLMLHDLKDMFTAAKGDLKECGVTFDAEGYMNIEQPVAEEAVYNGQFEALFKDKTNVISNIVNQSKSFSLDPMKYLHSKVTVTYPNPKRERFANPYMTSLYSGMFFNSCC